MKKKIMLINPYFAEGLKGFPLGLAYIAAVLRKKYDLSILDLTAKATIENEDPEKILKKELSIFKPDIVGITSTSPTHKNALDVAKIVKKYKDIPVIKGGVHETNAHGTTIKNHPEVDYSVVGEGEATILELVDRISENKTIHGVKGVIFKENGRIIDNGKRDLLSNLDDLPFPARDLFYTDKKLEKYYSANLFEGKKSTSIMSSRGCPYNCSFCSSKASWGRLRQRTVQNVIKNYPNYILRDLGGLCLKMI